MTFRDRLLATLRAIKPVLDVRGVMVAGSEVPNLLQPDGACTLVVSQNVDIAVPIELVAEVKARLPLLAGLQPSADEPSVWIDCAGSLLEVNFIGLDAATRDPAETYLLTDESFPLLVFGPVGMLRLGPSVALAGVDVPVPRLATLLMEKLVTERSAEKGDRDLLVALGLLTLADEAAMAELEALYRSLPGDLRFAARANLTVLGLIAPLPNMPDPSPHRALIARTLARLEQADGAAR